MANLIEKLAGSVPSWGAALAYGEKTAVGGQELVPVAVVCFGFGGGEGSGPAVAGTGTGSGEGSGGGGGGFAVPIGAYVGSPDGATFRPNPIALVVVAVPLVTSVGLALARILHAARSRASR